MKKQIIGGILGITGILVAGGSAFANDVATTTNNVLENTSRNLVSFNETGGNGTLSFTENNMYSKFCNHVSQGYIVSGDAIIGSGPGISTMMYCEGLPMTMEYAFTLENSGATFILSGDDLSITMGNNIFTFIKEDTTPIVGGDVDEYGCKGSAGYTWSQSQEKCIRTWEDNSSSLEKAYDFAYLNGITTIQTLEKFRADSYMTRQEAAKMLLATAQNVFAINIDEVTSSSECAYQDAATFDATLADSIMQACNLGIMKGSQGYFLPDGLLRKGQVLAIVVRLFDKWYPETTQGTWWDNYYTVAKDVGFTPFATLEDGYAYITRGELITQIYENYMSSSVSHTNE